MSKDLIKIVPLNWDTTTKKLKSFDGNKILKDVLEMVSNKIESQAKSNAPVKSGRLKSSISTQNLSMAKKVFVGVDYAPYQEFGTGSKVKVPSGWGPVAIKFKGTRKTKGVPAQPYFVPAVEESRKEIPQLLKQAYRKYV